MWTGHSKTVYLVPEFVRVPKLSSVLDACWQAIFEQELAIWAEDEHDWPEPRTRGTFDEWFDAEITMAVYDLVPEEPLTNEDVELADLQGARSHCAWCDAELKPEKGRLVSFALATRICCFGRAQRGARRSSGRSCRKR